MLYRSSSNQQRSEHPCNFKLRAINLGPDREEAQYRIHHINHVRLALLDLHVYIFIYTDIYIYIYINVTHNGLNKIKNCQNGLSSPSAPFSFEAVRQSGLN